MLDHRSLYIDGRWLAPSGQGMAEVINPATEEIAGSVPLGDERDVDAAVAAARKAFASWSRTPSSVRAGYIRALAEQLRSRRRIACRNTRLQCRRRSFTAAAGNRHVLPAHALLLQIVLEDADRRSFAARGPPVKNFDAFASENLVAGRRAERRGECHEFQR